MTPSEVFIPGEERLYDDLKDWRITMGDHVLRVRARNYEAAAVWLGVWCAEQGIVRCGADFFALGPENKDQEHG